MSFPRPRRMKFGPGSRHRARRAIVLLLLLGFLSAAAGQPKPTQYDVKAAYLYNFGKFVRWPELATKDFRLCIFGSDPFGPALDAIVKGESLEGKPITVKRITSEREAASCEIVFIPSSEQKSLAGVLNEVGKQHVLTVSDIPHFTEKGGAIGFIMQGERVRFEVNQEAAENAGLSLSSELLKVALAVRHSANKGGM